MKTPPVLILLLLLAGGIQAADRAPPNIVIILADDLGYGDLGCYGHPTIRTPELDRMATEGLRFTQFYSVSSVCSPSRGALLTGRLPIRTGVWNVLGPDSKGGLPAREVTIAQALKAKNYATACIGKWHLGHLQSYHPLRHGFDRYLGLLWSNDMKQLSLYRDDREIENPVEQHTLTERYTAEAVRFIRENGRQATKPRPFLLYLPHTMPHIPLAAGKRFQGKSRRGLYGDVVEEVDWSVGQVLQALRAEQVADNTLVLFTSDNGPPLSYGADGGSAGLLREGKWSTWDGGVRMPCIAWWPGTIKAGTMTAELASTMDLFPTALGLAGVPPPADRTIDGQDLRPILHGTGRSATEVLFFYDGAELRAVRQGPWKLHFKTTTSDGSYRTADHDPPLLFQIEQDPSERYDLAKDHPGVVASIRRAVAHHRAGLQTVPPQR